MAAVSRSETFSCSVGEFFSIIKDYESYPQFIPEVSSAKIVETQGDRKLVEFEVSLIKTFQYRLWLTEKEPHEISWKLESGNLFKDQVGSWKLSDNGGQTNAEYSLDVSFGMFVPSMVSNKVVKVNLPQMMQAYHDRVKAVYG